MLFWFPCSPWNSHTINRRLPACREHRLVVLSHAKTKHKQLKQRGLTRTSPWRGRKRNLRPWHRRHPNLDISQLASPCSRISEINEWLTDHKTHNDNIKHPHPASRGCGAIPTSRWLHSCNLAGLWLIRLHLLLLFQSFLLHLQDLLQFLQLVDLVLQLLCWLFRFLVDLIIKKFCEQRLEVSEIRWSRRARGADGRTWGGLHIGRTRGQPGSERARDGVASLALLGWWGQHRSNMLKGHQKTRDVKPKWWCPQGRGYTRSKEGLWPAVRACSTAEWRSAPGMARAQETLEFRIHSDASGK